MTFEELQIGQIFSNDSDLVFIKTYEDDDGYNSIGLHDGDLYEVGEDETVYPISEGFIAVSSKKGYRIEDGILSSSLSLLEEPKMAEQRQKKECSCTHNFLYEGCKCGAVV